MTAGRSSTLVAICAALVCATLAACGDKPAEEQPTAKADSSGSAVPDQDSVRVDQGITFPQLLSRLQGDNAQLVSGTIMQLLPMSDREELHRLLTAVWERDRASFPDLNWPVLETEPVRSATAFVLGHWEPEDPQYRDYVSSLVEHGETSDGKFMALFTLGAFAHEEDIARLETIANGPDDMLAAGAISGLIASNKEAAIEVVERIAADASVPEPKRKAVKLMLDRRHPPDDSAVR